MSRFNQLVASILSAALLITAPGIPAYAAAGRQVGQARGVSAAPALGRGAITGGLQAPLAVRGLEATRPGVLPGAVSLPGSAVGAEAVPLAAGPNGELRIDVDGGSQSLSSSIEQARGAAKAAAASNEEGGRALDRAFDAKLERGSDSAVDASNSGDSKASAGATLERGGSSFNNNGNGGGEPPAPPSTPGGRDSSTPRQPARWLVFGLSGLGAAAGWFAAPIALGLILAFYPDFAVAPAYVKAAAVAVGLTVGAAASQWPTWTGFPRALVDGAKSFASNTFRFWGRFGVVFADALGGRVSDMNKPLPESFKDYPGLAKAFLVVLGYPTAFLAAFVGVAYTILETPVLAAWRGLKQLLVEFLPWMADVLRFLKRVALRIFPFLAGLFVGGFKGLYIGAALVAGAVFMPAWSAVVRAKSAEGESVPALILAFATRLVAGVAVVAASVVGAVVGLVFSVPAALTNAVREAMKMADLTDYGFYRALDAWHTALSKDARIDALFESGFEAHKPVPVAALITRAFNVVLGAPFAVVSAALTALALYGRAWTKSATEPTFAVAPIEEVVPAAVQDGNFLTRFLRGVAAAVSAAAVTSGRYFAYKSRAAAKAWGFAEGKGAGLAGALNVLTLGFLPLLAAPLYAFVHEGVRRPISFLARKFIELIEKLWPHIRRFLNFLGRIIRRAFPAMFGFVAGFIVTTVVGAWMGAVAASRPFWNTMTGGNLTVEVQDGWNYVGSLALRVPVLVFVLGAGVLGAAVTLLTMLPTALTGAVIMAVKYSEPGGKAEAFAKVWADKAFEEGERVVETAEPFEGTMYPRGHAWRMLTGYLNGVLGLVPALLALIPMQYAALGRSIKRARLQAEGNGDSTYIPHKYVEPDAAKFEATPWKRPSVYLTLALMIPGLLAAGWFAWPYAMALAGWKAWAALAAATLAGGSVMGAFSRVQFWTGIPSSAKTHAKDGYGHSFATWKRAGERMVEAFTAKPAEGSNGAAIHKLAGVVSGAVFGSAGVFVGPVLLGVRAAGDAWAQVVTEDWLKRLIKNILRVFPFGFGLIVGTIGGVVGAGAVGAVLMGRPYFVHVAAPEYDAKGVIRFVAASLVRVVGLAFGLVAGLVGFVFGAAAGLLGGLFVVKAMTFALRFAGAEGGMRRYFELWGEALDGQLPPLMQLTGKLEFPQSGSEGLGIAEGLVRLLNISVAVFATTFIGPIVGYTGIIRSIGLAYKDFKAGKQPSGNSDAWSSDADRVAKTSSKVGRHLGGWLTPLALIGAYFTGMLAALSTFNTILLVGGALVLAPFVFGVVFWVLGMAMALLVGAAGLLKK